MTFYDVRASATAPPVALFTNVATVPWGRVELIIPQSLSTVSVQLVAFPVLSRPANWRRFDPGLGAPRQFSAGAYAIGRRLAPLLLESRPFTINRPEFVVPVPPPMIVLPWPQPPGNSGNVPVPTLADRYWSLYLWLAEGVKVTVWDEQRRWLWVRE